MPDLLIDGTWTAASAGGTLDVIDPADGEVFRTVDAAGPADVDAAVAAATRAFAGPWRATTAAERGRILDRVAELLQRDKARIAALETQDTGKTLPEGEQDVDDVTAVFRYYADVADKHPGRVVDAGDHRILSRIAHEPVGVCALIAPWNYPLLQISWKVAPAIAAGCTMVLKPSEVTPLTTIELARICVEAGVPDGVVNLLIGDGPSVGDPLTEHPDVDLVSFTGGLATGRAILRTCAETVKRTAIELGGKNPNVVFADADLDVALDQALNAAFFHSGQVCSAGARLIVDERIADDFVAELARRAERIVVGPGTDPASQTGPLVSAQQLEKIERFVASALAEGAELRAGGGRPEAPALRAGYFFRPTIFDRCTREMTIVREETFGPILSVERFATEAEAIELANDTEYGLAGAVWTSDAGRAHRVSRALRHGTVWINDFHPYLPQAEWGGFGRSGNGRELGEHGLEEYREAKHVWHNTEPARLDWFAGGEPS